MGDQRGCCSPQQWLSFTTPSPTITRHFFITMATALLFKECFRWIHSLHLKMMPPSHLSHQMGLNGFRQINKISSDITHARPERQRELRLS